MTQIEVYCVSALEIAGTILALVLAGAFVFAVIYICREEWIGRISRK